MGNVSLEELANTLYAKTLDHVVAVLRECELNGFESIIYVKDPSVDERIKMIGEFLPVMDAIESLMKDLQVKIKLTDASSCFSWLRLLLESAKLGDAESFTLAQGQLSKIVTL